MKKLKLEKALPGQKSLVRIGKGGIILLITILLLAGWMVNRLSTYGDKLEKIHQSKLKLELETWVLENQITQASSLIALEEKSSQLGFESIRNLQYINAHLRQ